MRPPHNHAISFKPVETLEPRCLLAAAADDLPYSSFYPEGYSHDRISEFVPITNTGNADARYQLVAHYEVGERDQVIAEGVIAAHTRGGVTISDAAHPDDRLVRKDTPYALVLRSSAPLAATMSHYDFGTAIGESFTDRAATEWTFGEGYKDHDWTRDFVVFYNATDQPAQVTLTVYTASGQQIQTSTTLEAHRRGGWSLDDDARIPSGVFGMKISSTQPIIAALSHYEIVTGRGYGALGSTDGGATAGIITAADFHDQHRRRGAADDGIDDHGGLRSGGADDGTPDQGPGDFPVDGADDFFSNPTYPANAYLTVLNSGTQDATVTLTVVAHDGYAMPGIAPVVISVPAGSRGGVSIRDLGLVGDDEFGVLYRSNTKVTVTAAIYEGNDATGQQAVDQAATEWRFGEGFMDASRAGRDLMEDLYIFNPSGQPVDATIEIVLSDGRTLSFTNTLSSLELDDVRLHDSQALLAAGPASFYGIRITAPTPIVATMEHWDRSLGGGFATAGIPAGVIVPLADVLAG